MWSKKDNWGLAVAYSGRSLAPRGFVSTLYLLPHLQISSAGFSSRPHHTSQILVAGMGQDIPVLSRPVPGFSNNHSIDCAILRGVYLVA